MLKQLMIMCLSLCLIVGCNSTGKLEFVQVVQDHCELTTETNTAVIATIQDEIAELDSQGALTDDAREGIEDLIARLQLGIIQAEVIEEYVNANEVNEDLLTRLLRARWHEGYEHENSNTEDVAPNR